MIGSWKQRSRSLSKILLGRSLDDSGKDFSLYSSSLLYTRMAMNSYPPFFCFFVLNSWSPDGAHITASNATNNKGYVFIAAVISRGTWTSEISLVGHENTVEVAVSPFSFGFILYLYKYLYMCGSWLTHAYNSFRHIIPTYLFETCRCLLYRRIYVRSLR